MRRLPPSSPPRAPRGQVTWVTLLILAVLAGGGYLGWAWIPAYIYNFQAKQAVRDYMNQAVKNRNDGRLVERLCTKLQSLGTVEVRDDDGTLQEVPAVDVSPGDVTWEADRDATPPTLHVAFEYTAHVRYPFLDRDDTKVFAIDFTEDITVPVWN